MPKLTASDVSDGINAAGRATRYLETIARACQGCPKRETFFCNNECGVRTAQDILKDLRLGNFSLGLIDNLTGKLECRNNDACYKEAARKAKDKRKNHHKSLTNQTKGKPKA